MILFMSFSILCHVSKQKKKTEAKERERQRERVSESTRRKRVGLLHPLQCRTRTHDVRRDEIATKHHDGLSEADFSNSSESKEHRLLLLKGYPGRIGPRTR